MGLRAKGDDMITVRASLQKALVMGVLGLPMMTGCNQQDVQEPGGGVGGTGTVPDRSRQGGTGTVEGPRG